MTEKLAWIVLSYEEIAQKLFPQVNVEIRHVMQVEDDKPKRQVRIYVSGEILPDWMRTEKLGAIPCLTFEELAGLEK